MATISVNGQSKEIKDGTRLVDELESLGVIFGCRKAECGICKSRVALGGENLTPRTEQEKTWDLPEGERLVCQCTILRGKVELKYP